MQRNAASALSILTMATALSVVGCAAPHKGGTGSGRAIVEAVADASAAVDAFHTAAAEADAERYFALLHQDAVFLGTDASERWTKSEFRAWIEAGGYFKEPPGWVYTPLRRHVTIGPSGSVAWFDEVLRNESYGDVRGSGVLLRSGGRWRIAQYNLHFAVPNEVAPEVVELIRSVE